LTAKQGQERSKRSEISFSGEDIAMSNTPSDSKSATQMTAAIPQPVQAPRETTHRFGRIGIPAVAAAAEIVKSSRKAEKPFHADFYRHFVD